jgi:hypothetical protein
MAGLFNGQDIQLLEDLSGKDLLSKRYKMNIENLMHYMPEDLTLLAVTRRFGLWTRGSKLFFWDCK